MAGGNAQRHLFLEHAYHLRYLGFPFQHPEHDLGRYVVREIADNAKLALEGHLHIQEALMNELVLYIRISFFQVLHFFGIQLYGFKVNTRYLQQVFGDGARAGAYFQHLLALDYR